MFIRTIAFLKKILKNNMKIHFAIGSLTGGGAERVLVLLATEFTKKHEVSIITFTGDEDYSYNKDVNRIKLHNGKINNHTLRRFSELFKYYSKKSNRPDIFISFLPPISFVTVPICKFFNIKIICSEHINYLQVENKTVSLTRKYIYKHANYLTVLTHFDKKYYIEKGINTVVMPNPATFNVIESNNHIRKKEIIAVGNLNRYHHKGFDNLIKIINPILLKNKDWTLRIIGSGNKGKEKLLKLIDNPLIKNKIIFDGFRSDIAEIMKTASIFILPSRFEGLPMVLLEAMSQGMACIAYNCKTGPSEMLENNKNGLLIPDQDIVKMRAGLSKLIEDSTLRLYLGNMATKTIDKYSMSKIIAKWDTIIDKI